MAVPAVTPVTTPLASTVAVAGALVLQTPPLVASAIFITAPAHALVPPVIIPTLGAALTLITLVATALPQLLVTL